MAGITFNFASGLNDSIFGKSIAPIQLFLEKRGEAFEQESIVDKLFQMGTDNSWGGKMTTMTAMDGFKPVGELGPHPADNMQEGYSKIYEHMVWKDRFSISREAVDDSKLMDLKQKPAAFVTGYYRTRERFGAALFGNAIQGRSSMDFAGVSFDTKVADGQNLFSKNHPGMVSKKTQSNLFADAFSNDALMAAETEMQNFKGDNDELLDVVPDTILIPNDYELKKAVFAAIGADKDPATANNGFNYTFGRWNVIIWAELNRFLASGTKPWLLLSQAYNDEKVGAFWRDRVKLEVSSYIDRDTNANVWDGYARFTAGFNDWRFAAVGGISGGTQLISG